MKNILGLEIKKLILPNPKSSDGKKSFDNDK